MALPRITWAAAAAWIAGVGFDLTDMDDDVARWCHSLVWGGLRLLVRRGGGVGSMDEH